MMNRLKLVSVLAAGLLLSGCTAAAPTVQPTKAATVEQSAAPTPTSSPVVVASYKDIASIEDAIRWALVMPSGTDNESNEILNTAKVLSNYVKSDARISASDASTLRTQLLKVELAAIKGTDVSEQRLMLSEAGTAVSEAIN